MGFGCACIASTLVTFLLSLQTPAGQKHILIDCGVHACDIHSINAAVAQMAEDTGRELALIIMTHRHADHISGFARCKDVFSQFTVEQVWMSWFEDPRITYRIFRTFGTDGFF
jgi:glyoxylase-like metal-dependent hydrolase (beta-lactamase superfamily II)